MNELFQTYPPDTGLRTFNHLFQDQATATPHHAAVVFRNRMLTYAMLNRYANRIAGHLRRQCHVAPNSKVGILLHRSENMIISMIGTLKAGAAYVPLDGRLPAARIAYIMEDAGISTLITEPDLLTDLPFFEGNVVLASELLQEPPTEEEEVPFVDTPGDIGYIIYTSGSTGKPKGVVIEHRSLADYIVTITGYLGISSMDRVLQQSTITFDISVEEIFPVLCAGGTLVVAEHNRDFYSIIKEIRDNKVTLISSTPEFIGLINNQPALFDQELTSLRCIVSGGDTLRPSHVSNIMDKVTIYNSYGPTESTVCATYHKVTGSDLAADTIPIGRPLPNRKIFILDGSRQLVPVGVVGEMYIGGEGLAREYLNLPGISNDRFIENPYLPGERLYRSGDLAKWLPDGNIEFAGRKDAQIKLRGYRIELGEIENTLLKHKDITDAVVLLQGEENKNKFLVAYTITRKKVGADRIKNFLTRYLPDYMVPEIYVPMSALPYTMNGKIDTKALPRPWEEGADEDGAASPVTPAQEAIVRVWGDVLKRKSIHINAHFFELGGNSLTAVEVISRVQELLHKELSLKDIFTYTCLKDLAAYVETLPEIGRTGIARADSSDVYPVPPAVGRMYLLWLMEPKSVAYNIPGLFQIVGSLETSRFEKAIQIIIRQHEILRTTFMMKEDIIVQQVHDSMPVPIQFYDHIPSGEVIDLVKGLANPFNPQILPLFRLFVITTDKEELFLFCDIHHIIFDGISYELFVAAIQTAYQSDEVIEPLLQYKDYSVWMHQRVNDGDLNKDRDFWLHYLGRELPVTELATDFPRPLVKSSKGAIIREVLDAGFAKEIRQAASDADCSLYIFMMAAFQLLLYKYTGRKQILIGTPVASRTHPDLENMIGLFINTVVIQVTVEPEATWNEWLQSGKLNVLDVMAHQEYPFDNLVEDLDVEPDISRNPLFQILFTFDQPGNTGLIPANSIQFLARRFEEASSKLDLTCNVDDRGNEIGINMTFNTDLFERATINRLLQHYMKLLKTVVTNGSQRIAELDILSEQEKYSQLYEFNRLFHSPAPVQDTICSLFERHVQHSGGKQILVYNGQRLSAAETDRMATAMAVSMAKLLRGKSNKVVALYLSPGLYTYIGILGILKAGAAFLPIDVTTPLDRLEYILQDAGVSLLITEQVPVTDLEFAGMVTTPGQLLRTPAGNEMVTLSPPVPEDLAYIIYTSGSTGRPKGVMIGHAALLNYVQWLAGAIQLQSDDATMLLTSYSFDLGYTALFPAMAFGVTLHMADRDLYLDPDKLFSYFKEEKITYIKLTPSLFSLLISDAGKGLSLCTSLRIIILGGEMLRYNDVAALFRSAGHIRVMNHYGPTETTIGCISMFVDKNNLPLYRDRCLLGKPANNTQILILDNDLQLMPAGCEGEICIGGMGVGKGYLNAEELTAKKFIRHPYIQDRIIYRTGDRGRWLPDGTVVFLGRLDNEVKIRGYRIAPAEVETILLEYSGVRQAVVVPYPYNDGEYFLAAYLVPGEGGTLHIPSLKNFLASRIPDYMIPERYVIVSNIPVTANGKADIKKLPAPAIGDETPYRPLQNDLQQRLGVIWQEVLGKGAGVIGADSNFFDAGGNSLRAARLANHISRGFMVSFPIAGVFLAPTPALQEEYIEKLKQDAYEPIVPIPDREYYDLSHAQLRLWILSQLSNAGISYNIPVTLSIEGNFDREAFRQACADMVARYEILRTVFVRTAEGPKQKILPAEGLPIEVELIPLDIQGAEAEAQHRLLGNAIDVKFDLSTWPLFRISIYEQQEGQYLLLMMFHHIITDGWSSAILCRDLIHLYNSYKNGAVAQLPPLAIQYRDYMAWHLGKGAVDKRAKKFWHDRLSQIPLLPLELPADRARPPVKTFNGDTIQFDIDTIDYQTLTRITADSTLFAGLVSVVGALLAAYTGRDSFVVGTPFAGRDHHDLEEQIGLFVNMLPLHIQCTPDDNFNTLMARHHAGLLEAFTHQHYPFDLIVQDLHLAADPSRSPIFDISIVLQNYERAVFSDLRELSVAPVYINYPGSKFDITFCFVQQDGRLTVNIEYNTDLFDEERMRQTGDHLRSLLKKMVEQPAIPLKEIEYLSVISLFDIPADKTLPLTSWGAMDKNALPMPAEVIPLADPVVDSSTYTETERLLISIRAEVLETSPDRIRLHDNFFDISGHSLLAIRLISKINMHFGIDFSVKEIFDHPTIAVLAKLIDAGDNGKQENITPLPPQEYYEVSNSQLRMWVLNQFRRWAKSYKIHGSFVLRGEINIRVLKQSFQHLIERHESLRTVFVVHEQGLKQKIRPSSAYKFKLEEIDISYAPENDDDALASIYQKIYQAAFNLAKGPLFKVYLIKKRPDEHYLIFSMHHIISDAWSVEVIIRDLVQCYTFYATGTGVLPLPLKIQYKEFAAWQNRLLQAESTEKARLYWKQQLQLPIPIVSLFDSANREGKVKGKRLTDAVETMLDKDLSAAAREYGASVDVTMFSFFLAVFKYVIARHSGLTDVVLGIPSSFRNKYALEDQVGIYINSLPIRTRFDGQSSFEQVLQLVKENVIAGMEHQDYPFDKMVQDTGASLQADTPPIFNIMYSFNSSALGTANDSIPGLEVKPYAPQVAGPPSNFNLVLFGMEEKEKYSFSWVYDMDIFTVDNIKLLESDFKNTISRVLNHAPEFKKS
ncbi:MAG TPA: amino acid adenylation domain-containing protein [Puia sp.]|nr:amino acid adenylation domain-containing protein [Puia sp.]